MKQCIQYIYINKINGHLYWEMGKKEQVPVVHMTA